MFFQGKDTMYSCGKHNYTGVNNPCPECQQQGKWTDDDMIAFANECNGHTPRGDYQLKLKEYKARKESS